MSLAERTVQRRRTWNVTSARVLPVLATFVLFVAMFAVGSIRYDNFFSLQVLLNLFIDNAYLIVLAVGMTFVIITGGIDLSVGSVVALSGVLAAKLLSVGWGPVSVIVLVLLMGLALGLAMGAIIHYLELQPFVVTLAGLFLARGLCYVISVESIPIRDPLFTAVAQGTVPLPGDAYVSPSVVVAVLVVMAGAYLLHSTRFGRTVYAIGGNQHSAVLMGLRVGRTKIAVYAISGLCSAIGGLLFAFYSLSGYSLSAVGTELDAIAATVIGGTLLSGGVGLIVGSLLGVLVLGLIQTFISFEGTLSSWWTRIVIGALLLVFVVLQRFLVRRST
jgi:galactofuranose transport system permease protein